MRRSFLWHLVSKAWVHVSKQCLCFTDIEVDGGEKDLYNLNLLAKLMVMHRLILFNLVIAAIAQSCSQVLETAHLL